MYSVLNYKKHGTEFNFVCLYSFGEACKIVDYMNEIRKNPDIEKFSVILGSKSDLDNDYYSDFNDFDDFLLRCLPNYFEENGEWILTFKIFGKIKEMR